MAATIYIVYALSDGAIVSARFGPSEGPPAPEAGQGVLNVGAPDVMPTARTHRVALGPPPGLVARGAADMAAEQNASVREALRRDIAALEAARERYASHGWPTAQMDARITDLLARHGAVP